MTTIHIDRYALTVEADGHADYNTGDDIVCAAASMLMYTLRTFACEHGGMALEKNGHMYVEFPPGENAYLIGGFDAVCEGLRLLSDEYPRHVCVMG